MLSAVDTSPSPSTNHSSLKRRARDSLDTEDLYISGKRYVYNAWLLEWTQE